MSPFYLPSADGTYQTYKMSGRTLAVAPDFRGRKNFRSRIAYAAAHVVLDPMRTLDLAQPVLDWDATLAYRRHLWSLGFGVAEAMDTAQRGMGLTWPLALELIQRSVPEARAAGGLIASGAGTDHLVLDDTLTLEDVLRAYLEQCSAVEAAGSRIILMASRALARVARSADDYAYIYGEVLRQVREPVILHWLGPMFDPALEGYWGSGDLNVAMDNCLNILSAHAPKVDGIKISLLSAELEIAMRRKLPPGVRMYTGDDFNYDRLILGDEHGHSDALLGIFDVIAPAAALAFEALDAGDTARYNELLAPTIPLSRHIFQTPTFAYKTGIVFLAWLNGFQSHFRMVGGAENARNIPHLGELFRLADQAGLLRDPEMAQRRMMLLLQWNGEI